MTVVWPYSFGNSGAADWAKVWSPRRFTWAWRGAVSLFKRGTKQSYASQPIPYSKIWWSGQSVLYFLRLPLAVVSYFISEQLLLWRKRISDTRKKGILIPTLHRNIGEFFKQRPRADSEDDCSWESGSSFGIQNNHINGWTIRHTISLTGLGRGLNPLMRVYNTFVLWDFEGSKNHEISDYHAQRKTWSQELPYQSPTVRREICKAKGDN